MKRPSSGLPPGNASTADAVVKLVPCPHCKKPAAFSAANRWRPFCSERCRNADLGAWASGSYRVAAAAPIDGDAVDGSPQPQH